MAARCSEAQPGWGRAATAALVARMGGGATVMQEETKGDDARLASCVDGETGERCPESGGGGLAPGGKHIRDRVYLPHQIELPNPLVFLKKKMPSYFDLGRQGVRPRENSGNPPRIGPPKGALSVKTVDARSTSTSIQWKQSSLQQPHTHTMMVQDRLTRKQQRT